MPTIDKHDSTTWSPASGVMKIPYFPRVHYYALREICLAKRWNQREALAVALELLAEKFSRGEHAELEERHRRFISTAPSEMLPLL